MKRTASTIRILICAAPLLALGGTATHAAGDPKTSTRIERRIEVRSEDAGPNGPSGRSRESVTFLGVEVAPVDEALAAHLKLPPDHGLVVRFVVPDSPAAAAGLQKNDVLTRLDDQLLIAPQQLSALVRSRQEGDTPRLTYLRAGSEARATVTLSKRVPPVASVDVLQWNGRAPDLHTFPAHHQFIFRGHDGETNEVHIERHTAPGTPAAAPQVRILRPSARVIYSEGDLTLEVTTGESGRQLEARRSDGTRLFSGPINTAEERAAVPEDVQKHLDKLDAIEPTRIQAPVAPLAPMPMPHATPAPAPGVTWHPQSMDGVAGHTRVVQALAPEAVVAVGPL